MQQKDFYQWQANSVTKEFFEAIAEELSGIEEDTAQGGCLEESPGATAMKYAERAGFISGVRMMMRFEPEFDDEN